MTDRLKLLIVLYHRSEVWRAPEWFAERLRQEFPDIDVVRRDGYEGIEQDLSDTDVMMNWSITPEQLKAAKKLRWIHSPAAAVHRLMIPELIASDVVVTSARALHGPVVAEHVLALVLALAKRLPSASRLQARRTWGQELLWDETPRPREIAGATIGLVGIGSIGSAVARLASAVGMRVVAARGTKITDTERAKGSEGTPVERTYSPDEVESMLGEADYVVLAAPVTPKTAGMMNERRLAAMKPDAYLINVARGALIDEPALIQALREKRIAGAALDVFGHEPLLPDSPLWTLENVLITPHSAALTSKLWERHFDFLRDNLRRFQLGEPLQGRVDKIRGY
jgi:phosphoglycerate dehydrogenase-like enzyme